MTLFVDTTAKDPALETRAVMDDDTMAEKLYEDSHGRRCVYMRGVVWANIRRAHGRDPSRLHQLAGSQQ